MNVKTTLCASWVGVRRYHLNKIGRKSKKKRINRAQSSRLICYDSIVEHLNNDLKEDNRKMGSKERRKTMSEILL